jgi:hypothetical protein
MTTRRIAILAAVLATLALASSASARPHPRDRHGCYANTTSAHYTTPTFRLAQTWGTRKSNLVVSSNIACSTAGALVRHWTRGGMTTLPLTPAKDGYPRGVADSPLTRKWRCGLAEGITCGRHWRHSRGPDPADRRGWEDQFVTFAYPVAI